MHTKHGIALFFVGAFVVAVAGCQESMDVDWRQAAIATPPAPLDAQPGPPDEPGRRAHPGPPWERGPGPGSGYFLTATATCGYDPNRPPYTYSGPNAIVSRDCDTGTWLFCDVKIPNGRIVNRLVLYGDDFSADTAHIEFRKRQYYFENSVLIASAASSNTTNVWESPPFSETIVNGSFAYYVWIDMPSASLGCEDILAYDVELRYSDPQW